jgi:hypothetical protein
MSCCLSQTSETLLPGTDICRGALAPSNDTLHHCPPHSMVTLLYEYLSRSFEFLSLFLTPSPVGHYGPGRFPLTSTTPSCLYKHLPSSYHVALSLSSSAAVLDRATPCRYLILHYWCSTTPS